MYATILGSIDVDGRAVLVGTTARALVAELVGTALLVAAVVGSGVAAVGWSDDVGVQLLLNALSTVAVLGVLIVVLGPTSGAHLNPVVTLALALRGAVTPAVAAGYVLVQVVGAVGGTLLAHAMFALPLYAPSVADRGGVGRLLGEVVATGGLVAVVLLARGPLAVVVPAWIGGAYVFTSSTSFANPAVTVGRALTDTFAGIRWTDVPWFVLAQVVGALAALLLVTLPRSDTP